MQAVDLICHDRLGFEDDPSRPGRDVDSGLFMCALNSLRIYDALNIGGLK